MTTDTERYMLRHVELEALIGRKWQLKVYDPHVFSGRSQTTLGYEFISPEGKILFAGHDFGCSPMNAIDSDECLRSLLGFLTLKPGDTESDYFADYTAEQLEFAESYECEALSLYAMDIDEESENVMPFVNLDGFSDE